MIREAAAKTGKTKTKYILEAVDEKLGLIKNREQAIRGMAGWLSHNEAEELRSSIEIFNSVDEDDWN